MGFVTDRDRIIAMLESAGFSNPNFVLRPGYMKFTEHQHENGEGSTILVCGGGISTGYWTEFDFDRDGKFTGIRVEA